MIGFRNREGACVAGRVLGITNSVFSLMHSHEVCLSTCVFGAPSVRDCGDGDGAGVTTSPGRSRSTLFSAIH